MRYRPLMMLAAGLTLACTAGAQSGLQIKVAFPSSAGYRTQAIPDHTRAVPVLIFHAGKLVDKTILTPRNPAALFRGLPLGDVEVYAAGFARGAVPTAVGKDIAGIKPANLAKAEIVMRETTSDPDLEKFRPFLDEIKAHIEREFASPLPSANSSLDPNLHIWPSSNPITEPSLKPTPTPTPAPANGGSSAPTIGTLTALANTPDTTLVGFTTAQGSVISLVDGDLVINGVSVGALAPTPGGNSDEENARAIADLINLTTNLHKVRGSTDSAGKVILTAKSTDINLNLSAAAVAITGLTSAAGPVTINKNPMNFHSGFPVLLRAPVTGSSSEVQVIVANGARTATYTFGGSQWLVTNPDPLTNSPIPLIGEKVIQFTSALQEGEFGTPIIGNGTLSLVWHTPAIAVSSKTFSLTVSVKNPVGTATSPSLPVTIVKPPNALVNTNATF